MPHTRSEAADARFKKLRDALVLGTTVNEIGRKFFILVNLNSAYSDTNRSKEKINFTDVGRCYFSLHKILNTEVSSSNRKLNMHTSAV
jgi:hypothetical protein